MREQKRLWAVRVGFEMVVCAGDEEDAKEIATQNAAVAVQSEESLPALAVRPVVSAADLPDGWADAWPWGDSDNGTCSEILA